MIRTLTLIALMAVATPAQADDWRFDGEALHAASCTGRGNPLPATRVDLEITPVDLDQTGRAASLPAGVSFAGGWHLVSDTSHFGGLSGLAVTEIGDLLAVTDTGRLVHLDMTDGAPTGVAHMTPLRFANPLLRPGKLTADAEGLAFRDGIALISFERDFRILALSLRDCDHLARAVRVADVPGRIEGRRVRANAGPESLWLDADGRLHLGYEQTHHGRAVRGTVQADGSVDLSVERAPLEPGFQLVGEDALTLSDGRRIKATLLRAYDGERGNRIRLHIDGVDGDFVDIRLVPPRQLDNFEGVALIETGLGVRAFLISDDNFSDRQRTFLYAFDIAPAGQAPDPR